MQVDEVRPALKREGSQESGEQGESMIGETDREAGQSILHSLALVVLRSLMRSSWGIEEFKELICCSGSYAQAETAGEKADPQ